MRLIAVVVCAACRHTLGQAGVGLTRTAVPMLAMAMITDEISDRFAAGGIPISECDWDSEMRCQNT